jgi:hypothetical protein
MDKLLAAQAAAALVSLHLEPTEVQVKLVLHIIAKLIIITDANKNHRNMEY